MPTPKWTVLFIVHAVDDQSRYYSEQLFTELMQANSSPEVRVLVLRNTYDYHDNTQTHAYLWEIKKDTDNEDVNKRNQIVKRRIFPKELDLSYKTPPENDFSFGDVNLGNDKTLEKILKSIKKSIGDSKVILFTWDHGCAFGIFDPTELDNPAAPIKSSPKTDMLMVKELANAIKGSFGKVEMLIMMNCWMQSIETNDQLNGFTDVLVAPETSIDWLGYNYIEIIDHLIENPAPTKNKIIPNVKKKAVQGSKAYQIKPTKFDDYLNNLAVTIIEKTKEKYREKYKNDENPDVKLDDIILLATRPSSSKLREIKNQLALLSDFLKSKLTTNAKEIALARQNCTELTEEFGGGGRPWCFIDILDLITQLQDQKVLDSNFDTTILQQQFQKDDPVNADSFIVEQHIGTNFKKSPFGGLSICFPNNMSFIKSSFYRTFYSFSDAKDSEKISFAKNVKEWAQFVEKVINSKDFVPKEKIDKNYSISYNCNLHLEGGNISFGPAVTNSMVENIDGFKIPVDSSNPFPTMNILLNLDVDLNIVDQDITIDSLIVQTGSFNGSGAKHDLNIKRGAGGGKLTGAGGGKTTGAGKGGGKTTGAGGGKTTGAGLAQLIEPAPLEILKPK